MPDFEVLDARIASALNRTILNSHFKKKGQSGGTKSPKRGPLPPRKTDSSPDLRILQDHGAINSLENYADLFTISSTK